MSKDDYVSVIPIEGEDFKFIIRGETSGDYLFMASDRGNVIISPTWWDRDTIDRAPVRDRYENVFTRSLSNNTRRAMRQAIREVWWSEKYAIRQSKRREKILADLYKWRNERHD